MILLWLVMALMIAASLLYFFVSLQKSLKQHDNDTQESFVARRTTEIAQE